MAVSFLPYFSASLSAQAAPKYYIARKVTDPIHIDGDAKEASWTLAPWSDDFIDIEGYIMPNTVRA